MMGGYRKWYPPISHASFRWFCSVEVGVGAKHPTQDPTKPKPYERRTPDVRVRCLREVHEQDESNNNAYPQKTDVLCSLGYHPVTNGSTYDKSHHKRHDSHTRFLSWSVGYYYFILYCQKSGVRVVQSLLLLTAMGYNKSR